MKIYYLIPEIGVAEISATLKKEKCDSLYQISNSLVWPLKKAAGSWRMTVDLPL